MSTETRRDETGTPAVAWLSSEQQRDWRALAELLANLPPALDAQLKRDAGIKDASHLMPAFGGLLDLIDSILYSAPVALFLWTVWPPVR